jgi:hypothetical protein
MIVTDLIFITCFRVHPLPEELCTSWFQYNEECYHASLQCLPASVPTLAAYVFARKGLEVRTKTDTTLAILPYFPKRRISCRTEIRLRGIRGTQYNGAGTITMCIINSYNVNHIPCISRISMFLPCFYLDKYSQN